jgi:hypothetical protein
MMKVKSIDGVGLAVWLLRIGVAFSFGYAGVASLLNPLEWEGFLPHFMTALVPAATLLGLFAAYELVLAVWLLSCKYGRYAALLAAATFAGITLTNLGELIVTFRDVSLILMALALGALER